MSTSSSSAGSTGEKAGGGGGGPKIVISKPRQIPQIEPSPARQRQQRRSFSLVERPPPIDTTALPRAHSNTSPLIQTSIVPSPGKRGRALTLGHITLPSASSSSATAFEHGEGEGEGGGGGGGMEDLAIIDTQSIGGEGGDEGQKTADSKKDCFFPDLSFDEGKTLNSLPETLIVVEDNVEPGLTVGFFQPSPSGAEAGNLASLSAAATAAVAQVPTPKVLNISTSGGRRSGGGGHARKDSLPAPLTPSPPMEIPLSASKKSFQQALDDARQSISADFREKPNKPENAQIRRSFSPAVPPFQAFKVSGNARPFSSSLGMGLGKSKKGEDPISTRSLFFQLLPYCMIYCAVYLLIVIIIAIFVIVFLRSQVVVENVRFESPSLAPGGSGRVETLLSFTLVNRYPWSTEVELEARLNEKSDILRVNWTRLESRQRKNVTVPFKITVTPGEYREMLPPTCQTTKKVGIEWKVKKKLLMGRIDFIYVLFTPSICNFKTGRNNTN